MAENELQQQLLFSAALHHALEAHELSEAKYRALYNDTPSMFFTVSEQDQVTSVNRYALEQLGRTQAELLGHNVLEIFVPEDRPEIKRQLTQCFAREGRVFRWEAHKLRKDGSVLTVREIARCGHGASGRKEVLIVCDDITAQKLAEAAVLQAQKREARGIAHDFNNLLAAMIGNTELALLTLPADSAAREPMEQVSIAGHRSAELVKHLLPKPPEEPVPQESPPGRKSP